MSSFKLACIGDSITFGYEIPEQNKWTSLLSKKLNIEVLNFGINGDTTNGMLSRFNNVLKENPSHILITGGTNDLWFGLKDEQIIANISAMVKYAKHKNIESIIGIPTPFLNLNEPNLVDEDYAECIRSFQARLIKFCDLKELSYVNFSKDINEVHFMDDGLHLNIKGQEIMMRNAEITLKKLGLI